MHLNWKFQLIATVCRQSSLDLVSALFDLNYLYMLLPVILLRRFKFHPVGPSAPLHTLGSFGCLSLRSLLTFYWAFVRLQFDDCIFLVLYLLWLGSITQRDRLLCLACSLLRTPADILIGLLSQLQWNVLIFGIDILLLPYPSIFLILCFNFALLENEECYTFKTRRIAVKRLFSWSYTTPTLRFALLVYSG